LIVYVHGAAFGVPLYSLEWLAELASVGYVVAAPAFRGEPLFYTPEYLQLKTHYVCEGEIENLKGEPRDVLAMADAARQLAAVQPGKFGILGHSFGAGAGLLAAARSDDVAVVISYDAWFVNPFRFYWERLRGGSRFYWDSWEAFCEQPVPAQLAGLMTRSIVHHADRVQAPVLLFIGEYDGQGYHDSHEDLVARLQRHMKIVKYEVVKEGGHNFVLYYDTEPARYAYRIQMQWLRKYLPPGPMGAEE
jgi:dipeptidyl aminopeptidase/acylaminoacyl peptidase